jgi:hypothetical protein
VRQVARLLVAAFFAALPAGYTLASCSTDAQGVEACRAIESARCQVAPLCSASFAGGFTADQVDQCLRFYRDECLVGVEAPEAGAPDPTACVAAINAAAACVADGGPGAPCPEVALADAGCGPDASLMPTPCNLIAVCPEALMACNFVAAPDAGVAVDTGTDTGTDAADATSE